ncbi:MAG: carbohydrate kinase [Anaerolineae bacterium]|nr:carbohydrate kinase [Anaerolineae bacterium]
MILCCGEALIDFVPLTGEHGYRPCPGGSIYNIAVGLGRLEVPVSFFSKISNDFFGDTLLEYLIENGVKTNYCPRSSAPTTLAFVSLSRDGEDSEPQYAFYATKSADRSLTESELPPLISKDVEALHFGSISLVMEPGATSLETLMRQESGKRIISLDPNIRPGLIHDRDAYRHRFNEWVKLVDIIKLSQVDLNWIYPDEEIEEVIENWFREGISLCILTLGSEGARGFIPNNQPVFVPTPKVEIADTVGAGETFLAATLAYLHGSGFLCNKDELQNISAKQLSDCLNYANRAAMINCTREGANPPYKHELESNND